MRKKRMGSEGFTLVELIVVIAILGILAGAGTVAYTGYVQRAQKITDQQNVANLMYAAQLADYADSSLFGDDGSGLVIITESGASAYGTYGDYASALENGIGSLSSMSLSYGGYSTSASTYSMMLSNVAALSSYTSGTDSEGNTVTYSIGYADVASDLWAEVIGTATKAAKALGFNDEIAANYTLLVAYATAYYSSMEDMGGAWSEGKAYSYSFSTSLSDAANSGNAVASYMSVANNLALPASRKAYNEAFAVYLAANYSYNGIDDDVAALKDEHGEVLVSAGKSTSGNSKYDEAVSAYLGAQAKLDGAAYYQAMYSVNKAYGTGTDDSGNTVEYATDDLINVDDADTFWSETSAYVASVVAAYKNYDSIAEMLAALENVDGSAVVILATKSSGKLSCTVSPSELDLREESNSSSDTSTLTPTLTLGAESLTLGTGKSKSVSCSVENFSGDVSVSCTSGDSSVATAKQGSSVSTDYISVNVTGVSAGTTTITITVTDGTNTATANLSVKVVEVSTPNIALTPSGGSGTSDDPYTSCTLTPSGDVVLTTTSDTAIVYIQVDGTTLRSSKLSGYSYSGDFVSATSTDTAIATVTANTSGSLSVKVAPVSEGNTTITVTIMGQNCTLNVTVIDS